MLARERLMPAPGLAWCRSAYFGGAIRFSTRRGTFDRIAAFAVCCRRWDCGELPFDWRRERLIAHLRAVCITVSVS
jgi:hypothetical protein